MRALPLLAVLLLAGCTGPADDLAAPTDPSQASTASPLAVAAPLAPLFINGTIDSAGLCALPDGQRPGELPAGQDLQPVPAAAWNRTYEGPAVGSALVNGGAPCLVWLDADGARLPESGGKVPAGAARVAVQGTVQVGVAYSIKVA